jgi:phenylacetyl-CoA:acceptor oxidoreductase 26-kDa subunit
VTTATLNGAPRLQRSWDTRAALNFIGGGAGTGLLVATAAAVSFGWPFFPAGALAILLIGFGLSMVWMEIGRPLRALNVFFHPQTSWMTREALLAVPLMALAAVTVVVDQGLVVSPAAVRMSVTPFALATAVLALGFLFCQARMLRASLGVPAWREPALQPLMMITGLTEGLGLLLFLAVFVGQPPAWAVLAAFVALVARSVAWQYYQLRLRMRAPAAAIAALDRVSIPVHVVGHILPAVLLVSALLVPNGALLAAIAGLALVVAGAWLKFVVVTRAAFTQGYSLPFVPVRGRSSSALLRRG